MTRRGVIVIVRRTGGNEHARACHGGCMRLASCHRDGGASFRRHDHGPLAGLAGPVGRLGRPVASTWRVGRSLSGRFRSTTALKRVQSPLTGLLSYGAWAHELPVGSTWPVPAAKFEKPPPGGGVPAGSMGVPALEPALSGGAGRDIELQYATPRHPAYSRSPSRPRTSLCRRTKAGS